LDIKPKVEERANVNSILRSLIGSSGSSKKTASFDLAQQETNEGLRKSSASGNSKAKKGKGQVSQLN
jgi:hypothetical protein